jgi:hypothetical protein
MYVMGIDPDKVTDSLDPPQFALGQLGCDHLGCIYQYQQAGGAIDAKDFVVFEETGTQALTTSLADAANGAAIGLAPASPSQAIADNDFAWFCIYAPVSAGKTGNFVGGTVKDVALYASGTAGHLDDAFDLSCKVLGVWLTTTAGSAAQAEVVSLTFPHLTSDIDTATGGGG